MKSTIFYAILFAFGLSLNVIGQVIYVNHSAGGSNNGSSWTNAYKLVQDAIDNSSSGDSIFIARGRYEPTTVLGSTMSRDKSFLLKSGVSLFGGFDGSESTLEDRDSSDIFDNNQTILTGDLGIKSDSSDNCYHVVVAIGTASSTIMDGLIVSGGNANDSSYNTINNVPINRGEGGGIYAYNSDLTINNCVIGINLAFLNGAGMNNINCGSGTSINNTQFFNNKIWGSNSNDHGGAGMRNLSSSPELVNVKFTSNMTQNVQGGGGIRNVDSSPTLDYCLFDGNRTYNADGGAGMYNSTLSNPMISNTAFENNYTINQGGGMYNDNSVPELNYVEFIGNTALDGGGAMENDGGSHVILNDVTFENNKTDVNGGAIQNWKSSPVIKDAVFYNNEAKQDGGAIFNYNDCSPIITNAFFNMNQALGNGGAVYNRRNCNPILTNILAYENYAGSLGGAIFSVESNTSPCSPILTNATIVKNRADSSGGGAYDDGAGNSKLRNSLVLYNTSPGADDIEAPASMVTTALLRTIIGNEYYQGGATLPIIITGQLFVDTASDNYQLSQGSYGINKGDNSLYNASKIPDLSNVLFDIRGANRIMLSSIDLGAYEVCADTTQLYVDLSVSPGNVISFGSPLTFKATYTGGGTSPEFIWTIKGNNPQTIMNQIDSIHGIAGIDFLTGDQVSVAIHSSDACDLPLEYTSNTITLDVIQGLSKTNDYRSIVAFPNPSNGQFTLVGDLPEGRCQLTICDVSGKNVCNEIRNNLANSSQDFDLSLKTGLYIVRIQPENQIPITLKINIQND